MEAKDLLALCLAEQRPFKSISLLFCKFTVVKDIPLITICFTFFHYILKTDIYLNTYHYMVSGAIHLIGQIIIIFHQDAGF